MTDENVTDLTQQRLNRLERESSSGFAEMRAGFQEMREGFARIDRRFGEIDQRFDDIDQRFEEIDHRFNELEHVIVLGFQGVREQVDRLRRRTRLYDRRRPRRPTDR